MSRIGKRPVDMPSGVSAATSGQTIEVKGPKGTRSFTATDDVDLKIEENVIRIAPRGSSKRARQQWGMTRTQVANLVTANHDTYPMPGGSYARGVVVATLKEMEVLAMKFTGPYPLDDSLEKILVNYGRDLEIEPAGPARYLVLSDPEVGAPADLRQEIRLPVRKAE